MRISSLLGITGAYACTKRLYLAFLRVSFVYLMTMSYFLYLLYFYLRHILCIYYIFIFENSGPALKVNTVGPSLMKLLQVLFCGDGKNRCVAIASLDLRRRRRSRPYSRPYGEAKPTRRAVGAPKAVAEARSDIKDRVAVGLEKGA